MKFIYRRLVFYAAALWGALTLNFLLPRLMPGSPIDSFILRYRDEIRQNPHLIDSLRIELGAPQESLPLQYVHYVGNMLHGDFGTSYSYYPAPVMQIIGATLPWTLFLAGMATVLAFVLGTSMGMVVAWRRGGPLDSILPPIMMFFSAFPSFFLALLAVYFFGLKAGWFPLQHAYSDQSAPELTPAFLKDMFYHAALPVLVVVVVSTGGWLLGMRNVMINTIAEDYITMAHTKGLADWRVMFFYAARNAILPNLTGFAIALGYIVGGVTLVEVVFSYPGVGNTLVKAALGSDYPLVQALLLLISLCVLAANFLVDLLYVRLDPRAASQ